MRRTTPQGAPSAQPQSICLTAISSARAHRGARAARATGRCGPRCGTARIPSARHRARRSPPRRCPADRKSTRLNSSHDQISYAVFCLKKKKIQVVVAFDIQTTRHKTTHNHTSHYVPGTISTPYVALQTQPLRSAHVKTPTTTYVMVTA